jgi:hypothetical protein
MQLEMTRHNTSPATLDNKLLIGKALIPPKAA